MLYATERDNCLEKLVLCPASCRFLGGILLHPPHNTGGQINHICYYTITNYWSFSSTIFFVASLKEA